MKIKHGLPTFRATIPKVLLLLTILTPALSFKASAMGIAGFGATYIQNCGTGTIPGACGAYTLLASPATDPAQTWTIATDSSGNGFARLKVLVTVSTSTSNSAVTMWHEIDPVCLPGGGCITAVQLETHTLKCLAAPTGCPGDPYVYLHLRCEKGIVKGGWPGVSGEDGYNMGSSGTQYAHVKLSTGTGSGLIQIPSPGGSPSLDYWIIKCHNLPLATAAQMSSATLFTDSSLNPLTLDSSGNPKVDMVLARGIVKSTSPGQIIAVTILTNTGNITLRSAQINETLPMDWWIPVGMITDPTAIHAFLVPCNGTSVDITNSTTVAVTSGNPEFLSWKGEPTPVALSPCDMIVLTAKLEYGLTGTPQSPLSFPRNYTSATSALAATGQNFKGTITDPDTASTSFVVYAKVFGDVNGDLKVNIVDLVQVAIIFNSVKGDSNYNPAADLNNDGIINILDLTTVAIYFGS